MSNESERKWHIMKEDVSKVAKIALSLPKVAKIAGVLVNRGIDTVEKVKEFLNCGIENLHNPFLFYDTQKAVEKIRKSLKLKEKILVYGDKDVDGVTSVNVIVNTLRILGGDILWYVPAEEGYGISKDVLSRFALEKVKLLITVDSGISAIEEVDYAKQLGMYVILTDHHEPPYEGIPKADAVINPKIFDSGYPFRDIAGCTVALKLMYALIFSYHEEYDKDILLCYCQESLITCIHMKNGIKLNEKKFDSVSGIKHNFKNVFKVYVSSKNLKSSLLQDICNRIVVFNDIIEDVYSIEKAYKKEILKDKNIKSFFENNLDLCCLGTIADSVPLVQENRAIVKNGLEIIENNPHSHTGLGLLIDNILISKGTSNITAKLVSWNVTPVLNSSGRMSKGILSAKLLMTKDLKKAKKLYEDILKLNKHRKYLQSENIEQFKHLLKEQCNLESDKVLIVKASNLEHGVTGIIASQMVKTYSKPAFLFITDGKEATGAARSIEGFDVVAALESVKDILIKYGGHNQAAGFTLNDSKIGEFIRRISDYANKNLEKTSYDKTILIENELKISDITVDFYEQVQTMEPFGMGNAKPIFYIKNVTPTEVTVFGNKGEHLKFKISHKGSKNVQAVFWNKSKFAKAVKSEALLDVAFYVDIIERNRNKLVQLQVVDIRPALA
ncbi:MAG: single-stranded-DNA-specific exonuclease RecJ [Endomicrobium sp.]|jgi:single-stranded-DNA-specific exonuclease|uniref:single-stranded-DNA-specific exonuclease RecJ n=1 Tax=Candidatus Endomicrobiellum cubanum TaxID=3242325 RepID=UPI00282CA994|nr:single-stranded-DNA-specific exonuclease RecJ [Endomicrobium sp.]